MPYNLDIPGFMSLGDLKVVESLAKRVPKKGTIIEVGSFMGRSAWTFAKSTSTDVKVYCIDCWESEIDTHSQNVMANYKEGMLNDFNTFKHYTRDCPNIIPIQGFSTEVKWPKNKKADLIFIDASHKSPDVDNDLEYWFPFLKKQGIICGHDFNPFVFPDVCRAVMNLSEQLQHPITFFKGSTIWSIDLSGNSSINTNPLTSSPLILEKIKKIISHGQIDTDNISI